MMVKAYIDGCNKYQYIKNRTQLLADKLVANKQHDGPWRHLTVDFIVKLPEVLACNSILIIVCRTMNVIIHDS